MATEKIPGGLSADDFLEQEVGGVHHKAVVLSMLGSEVEGARHEWEGDDNPVAAEIHRLCVELDDYLKTVFILPDGELTLRHRCRRCGGEGGWSDESPCNECLGAGSTVGDV
jgi:hypothetical protein